MARDIADLAGKLLFPAQAAGILLPLFVTVRARSGGPDAWRAAAAILTLVGLAGLPVVAVAVAAAPALVSILAPGFDDATAELTSTLLRIVAPALWFTALGALASSLLQARERFGAAMGANMLGAFTLVASLPPLVHWLDVEGAALAMLFSSMAQALSSWALVVRDGLPVVRAPWREREAVLDFIRRSLPFLSFVAAGQASGAAFRIAASTLGSAVYAALALAYRLHRSLLSLVLSPVQYVLLPALTRSEVEDRRTQADTELVATLRQIVFLVTPIVALVVVLRDPTVSFMFERGDFDTEARRETAGILGALALATLPTIMHALLEQAAYARRRTRLVVRTNVAVELTQGVCYFPLVALLGGPGIAFAFVAATGLATVVYVAALGPFAGPSIRAHALFVAAVAACCAGLVAGAVGIREAVTAAAAPAAGFEQALVIVPAALVGLLAYIAIAAVLRIEEPKNLSRALREVAGGAVARMRPGT